MQWQFQMQTIPCLKQVKGEVRSQEETQEVRLSDGMPDAGRVLGVWGQVMVRGKQWQEDAAQINCNVNVWVLYAPADGSQAQCVESWIPMTIPWDIPGQQPDGTLNVQCLLRTADARILSGRKLMLRVTVSAMGRLYVPAEARYYEPVELPEDVQLLQKTYPVCLIREAGEKAYMLDEDLVLPETAPAPDRLIRYALQPEINEQKVLGDKVVFRGSTLAHILYRTVEGALASWDFEVPFSQYTELEKAYGHDSQVQILPILTASELTMQEQGRFRLKAGFSAQYLLMETTPVTVVEDAYSPDREVRVQQEQVQLPVVLESQTQRIRAEQTVPLGVSRVADVAFYPSAARKDRMLDGVSLELPGSFQVLYYDTEGVLQSGSVQWQTELRMGLAQNAELTGVVLPSGKAQAVGDGESMVTRGELLLSAITHGEQELPMISELTAGEPVAKDPHRPTMVLRRAGQDTLWQIAKENGSTVDAIRRYNGIVSDPEPDRMLLIPVK